MRKHRSSQNWWEWKKLFGRGTSGDFNAMCVEKNLAIAKNAIDLIPSHVVIYVPTPKNKKAHTWRCWIQKWHFPWEEPHIHEFSEFCNNNRFDPQNSDKHSTQKCSGLFLSGIVAFKRPLNRADFIADKGIDFLNIRLRTSFKLYTDLALTDVNTCL